MRSHAKASAAGSNREGEGRLALLAIVCAALLGLLVLVASASASKSHPFKELFGSAAQPTFNSAHGIAVNQSSGDVLVMDAGGTPSIKRYKPDGTPDDFSALASNVIDGAGGADATPQGGLSFASAFESQIAVDNSGTATDGDIYVTQSFPNVIDIFAATGAYLGQLSESSGGSFSEACGVAVDPSGNAYVGDFFGGIHKFTQPGSPHNPLENSDNTANFNTTTNPCALAAGAGATAGFLFANQYSGPVTKIDASTGELKYTVATGSHTTISVDPDTGHVYTAAGKTINEFDASGAGSATAVSNKTELADQVQGLAIRGSTGDIYASRFGQSKLEVFGPTLVTFPDVTTSAATNNTGTHATLNGTVVPDGVELSECFFEWGRFTFQGGGDLSEHTAPCVESNATIGTGTSPVAVHADLSGLVPQGANYKFRLVAKNSETAAVKGSEQSFATPNTVITTAASGLTDTTATLNGTVNPDGATISECVFEWGPPKEAGEANQHYPETAPCEPGPGSITGTSPVAVHADLSGLHAGTEYVYRLKATYPTGPITGAQLSTQTVGPKILASWSEDVVRTEAILKAEIDPEGSTTTYHFEYGTSPAYGSQTPEIEVGSDSSVHTVARFLEGLTPGTTYHYRTVATSGAAENAGPDQTFTTYAPVALDTACPNQANRYGAGANLPDCRAYEMVSPLDKGGRGIVAGKTRPAGFTRAAFDKAAIGGDAITYTSGTSFGDEPSNSNANQYLSRRGPEGWSTHGISPRRGDTVANGVASVTAWAFDTPFASFSEDLSSAWLRDANATPLSPEAVEGFANVYRRDNLDGTYHDPAITSPPLLVKEAPYGELLENGYDSLGIEGSSADGSQVVFQANGQLIPGAVATVEQSQIYGYSGGELHVVSVLPGGESAPRYSYVGERLPDDDTAINQNYSFVRHAVSDDGSHIFWTYRDGNDVGSEFGPGKIYVRIDNAETVPVSESVTTEPANFRDASTDGSKALFSVDPDGNGPLAEDLYEFDVPTETATLIAHEVTAFPGGSDDLSKFYFVSREALGGAAVAGEENLYLDREGDVSFIATLSSGDVFGGTDSAPSVGGRRGIDRLGIDPRQLGVRVTADGNHLAFMSNRPLTGYDNSDAADGEADVEVYLYDAGSEELTCVSCNPSGARPQGEGTQAPDFTLGLPERPASHWRTAAWIPTSEHELETSRVLSADGNRIFFNSMDALVPEDTNGHQDVYEWEAPGTGGCTTASAAYSSQDEGCISLISTGKSSTYSEFIDASAGGNDVFIRTESGLDPRDPGLMDVYDASEGGGYPPPPAPPVPCIGDSCQSPPAAPQSATPASASFHGAGNKVAVRSCGAQARRAAKLNRQAKQLARAAKKAASAKQAKAMRKHSSRLAKRAGKLSKASRRCRRSGGGAGR